MRREYTGGRLTFLEANGGRQVLADAVLAQGGHFPRGLVEPLVMDAYPSEDWLKSSGWQPNLCQ